MLDSVRLDGKVDGFVMATASKTLYFISLRSFRCWYKPLLQKLAELEISCARDLRRRLVLNLLLPALCFLTALTYRLPYNAIQ